MSRNRALFTVLALGLVWGLGDQVTKFLAVAHLTTLFPPEAGLLEQLRLFYGTHGLYGLALPPAEILPPFWNHLYVQNAAGAFGLLGGAPLLVRRIVFSAVAVLASVGLLWMARMHAGPGNRLTRLALGLVLGGALGNLLDRLVHGYVIDFVDWHWGNHHWPAFNLADVGIVVGVFGLLFLLNREPAPAGEIPQAD